MALPLQLRPFFLFFSCIFYSFLPCSFYLLLSALLEIVSTVSSFISSIAAQVLTSKSVSAAKRSECSDRYCLMRERLSVGSVGEHRTGSRQVRRRMIYAEG